MGFSFWTLADSSKVKKKKFLTVSIAADIADPYPDSSSYLPLLQNLSLQEELKTASGKVEIGRQKENYTSGTGRNTC